MRAEQRRFHFLYQVTCIPTGRYYIGMHSTNNLDDGYKGSGKILWFSRRKYGDEAHRFEITEQISSRHLLRDAEIQAIAKVKGDPLCMNLKNGGEGGWDYVNEQGRCPLHQKQSQMPAYLREKVLAGMRKGNSNPSRREKNIEHLGTGMLGKNHTVETKQAMSAAHAGTRNSQFGTVWMTRDGKSVKCPTTDIQELAEQGWTRGRK